MRSDTKSLQQYAESYAKAGIKVIPLYTIKENGKCDCGKRTCRTPGKHPRIKEWQKRCSSDLSQIKEWWKKWPNASIAGVGGEKYVCLDIDIKHSDKGKNGSESLAELIKVNGQLPDTASVETGEVNGERGLHYWFKIPAKSDIRKLEGVRPGIDIRGKDSYALLPPSPHPSGVTYQWISDIPLKDAAMCPQWILELVPTYAKGDSSWQPDSTFTYKTVSREVKQFWKGKYQPEVGEQREFLTRAARAALGIGKTVVETAELLYEGEKGKGGIVHSDQDEGWPWRYYEDIYRLVLSEFHQPPSRPLEKDFSKKYFHQTDSGNASRLIESFSGEHIFYCPDFQTWFIWDKDKKRFREDIAASGMKRRHIELSEKELEYALENYDDDGMREKLRWAKASSMHSKINAAVEVANVNSDLWKRDSELDPDPFLFGVANGVVDLRTGELLENTPSKLVTKYSTVEYEKGAKPLLFKDFLEKTIPDRELRDFIQTLCGYTLTGSTEEEKFMYIYGKPATGKSTFLMALSTVLGDYYGTANINTFLRTKNLGGSAASPDLANLAGKRMVVSTEVEEGERFAAARLSQLTGGDKVVARKLHKEPMEFTPRFKLWIAANNYASSSHSGIGRRMIIIPFDHEIPEADRDIKLGNKLAQPAVLRGILNWLVEGAMQWCENYNGTGRELEAPIKVQEKKREWEQETDYVMAFVSEALEDGTGEDRISKGAMYQAFEAWLETNGFHHPLSAPKFSRRMTNNTHYNYLRERVGGDLNYFWKQVKFKDTFLEQYKPFEHKLTARNLGIKVPQLEGNK